MREAQDRGEEVLSSELSGTNSQLRTQHFPGARLPTQNFQCFSFAFPVNSFLIPNSSFRILSPTSNSEPRTQNSELPIDSAQAQLARFLLSRTRTHEPCSMQSDT